MQVDMRPEVLFYKTYELFDIDEKKQYYTQYVVCGNCKARRRLAILKGIRVASILVKYVVPCKYCECVSNSAQIRSIGTLEILPK